MLSPLRHRQFLLRNLNTRPMHSNQRVWKSAAPPPPAHTTTFAAQSTLPRLPVAPLAPSLTKLKQTLKPLAWSHAEYAEAEKKIDHFAKSPLAAQLHARLVERAAENPHWLESWWDDLAYLGYRDSVRPQSSDHSYPHFLIFFFIGCGQCVLLLYGGLFSYNPPIDPPRYRRLRCSPSSSCPNPRRSGCCTHPSSHDLPPAPETRNTPSRIHQRRPALHGHVPVRTSLTRITLFLPTSHARWMFDCCRVPGPDGLDWSVTYAKQGDLGDSGHIVVFRQNRPWKVDTAKDGRILSTAELERSVPLTRPHTVLIPTFLLHSDNSSTSMITPHTNTPVSASCLHPIGTFGQRFASIPFSHAF